MNEIKMNFFVQRKGKKRGNSCDELVSWIGLDDRGRKAKRFLNF